MKVTREIYSEWGTLISSVTIHGTTLRKLAKKYSATVEQGGRTFSMVIGNQTIIYKQK